MNDEKIFVTQPFLPPLDEMMPYLEQIWQSRQLTNNGPFHQELETKLCKYLNVPYISLFANGTLALLTALQALNITGEVITTPFSFVATTHALWWNNIKPVFADIEQNYCTLDPEKIESAITPQTTAIMPVHVYGYPCLVDDFKFIAEKHGLKLIYDAAHTFGSILNGHHLAEFGDLSVLSFHATKVFNTFEGGAIVSHTQQMKHHIDNLKNFGFRGETVVEEPGINGKMNELQAAIGLLQLKYIEENIQKRKQIAEVYYEQLTSVPGIRFIEPAQNMRHNYAYFPVFIDEQKFGMSRDALYEKLQSHNVFCRRYFYPLISRFPPYRELSSADPAKLAVSRQVSESVICLPIYPDLNYSSVLNISQIIADGK